MKSLVESLNTELNEYFSPVAISNWDELLSGLKEIKAPVEINPKEKSITVDGANYRFPKDRDIMKTINYDDKIISALNSNKELANMWKTVNAKYSLILENVREFFKDPNNKLHDPQNIHWGAMGPLELNSFANRARKANDFMKSIVSSKSAQKTLKEYEVLRTLFDRGYSK